MRVLMLYNDYQVLGGENLSVAEEAAGLADVGVECRLYTVSNDELHGRSRLQGARMVAAGGDERPDLLELAREFQPHLIHAQNLFPLLPRATAQLLRHTRLPWVRHLRNYRMRCVSADLWRDGQLCGSCSSARTGVPGVVHACYRSSRPESLGAVLASRAEHRLLAGLPPAAYIALSSGMASALEPALAHGIPVHVKPDGLTDRGPLAEGDPSAGSSGDRECLFVGRLAPAKGYRHVIDLARARPQLRFTLIGDGAGATEVDAAAGGLPNLTWHRALPHLEVLERMRRAWLVLAPSQWEEPFGRVAAEAASMGTPALVQAVGGLEEIVKPVDTRLAVTGRDIGGWAEALDVLTALGPDEWTRLRRRSQEHFQAHYRLAVTSARLADIYDTVLAGVRAR